MASNLQFFDGADLSAGLQASPQVDGGGTGNGTEFCIAVQTSGTTSYSIDVDVAVTELNGVFNWKTLGAITADGDYWYSFNDGYGHDLYAPHIRLNVTAANGPGPMKISAAGFTVR